jgi:hypothetical protein
MKMPASCSIRNGHEGIVVNDTIDQAPSQRCLRVDRLPEKQQLRRSEMTDGARQQQRAGSFGNQAKVDKRQRQAGAPCGDNEIAMLQQRRPYTDGRALHRGDQNFRHRRNCPQKAECRATQTGRRVGKKSAQIAMADTITSDPALTAATTGSRRM